MSELPDFAAMSNEALIAEDATLAERYWDLHDELDALVITRAAVRNVLQDRRTHDV